MTCKIFYQRDYLSLLIKYGLESPTASGAKTLNGDAGDGPGRGLFDLAADDDLPAPAEPQPARRGAPGAS